MNWVGDVDTALSIDTLTGQVTLNENPDAEVKPEYTFTIRATDTAEIPLSAEQTVTISVNNLDEVAPAITSNDTAAAINENSGTNQVVYTATADDSADISGGVTFSLAADSDAALSIDSVSGAVTLSVNPDQETQDQYTLTVIATDAAGNASEQQLSLAINDLDEVAPTVTSAVIAQAIEENSGANQVIYTAVADDSADISAQPVIFSLNASSDSELSIDQATGAVSLSDNPVFTDKSVYTFTVIATDNAGNNSVGKTVTLGINEAVPPAASITLVTDSGASTNDNISDTGLVQVNGIKPGATWQYSLDYVDENNATWITGVGASFEISPLEGAGTFNVNVRVTNDSNGRYADMASALQVTIDTSAPTVELISADSETNLVSITYNEQLSTRAS